ncbi:hypothetical protein [Streptomyces lydicus]|uniref:hypothetical protein n=1 Tax=Streptomyces lydicus TaxID=47763 RepID=UPI00382AE792
MTTIQVRGLGRLLLIVVTLVLALPLVAGGTYGERAAAPPAAGNSAAGTGSPGSAPLASDPSDHPEAAGDRCQPRRGGRSAATLCAPAPPGTPVSTAGPVRTEGGLRVTVPLTGRQAVPLSRSGELPVRHLVFRC